QDIELVVSERVPMLRKGRIAAFPAVLEDVETIGIAAEISAGKLRRVDQRTLLQSIADSIASAFQEPVGVILLLGAGCLPRTSSGKIRRSACMQGWKDGSLEALATWMRNGSGIDFLRTSRTEPVDDFERQIAYLWEEVLGVPAVDMTAD